MLTLEEGSLRKRYIVSEMKTFPICAGLQGRPPCLKMRSWKILLGMHTGSIPSAYALFPPPTF